MKVLKLKKFFLWVVVLTFALIVLSALAVGVRGANTPVAEAASGSAKINLVFNPDPIVSSDAHKPFTVSIRITNVASVTGGGGIYSSTVKLTPADDVKGMLEFVEFVKSPTTECTQSATTRKSEHTQGNFVIIDGGNQGFPPNTKDYTIGGFKFKLKDSVTTLPEKITFEYEDQKSADCAGQTLGMASGSASVTFRGTESNADLSALSITAGGKTVLNSTADGVQTATEDVEYADRNVKLTVNRAGKYSQIQVTLDGKNAVSKGAKDVTNLALGNLDAGDHTVVVTVTAEDNSTKTYTLKFKVKEAPKPADQILTPPELKPDNASKGYSGEPIDFTPDGMAGMAGKLDFQISKDGGSTFAPATVDDFKQKDVGSYIIKATPKSPNEWDGDSANKNSPKEFSFTVKKATLTVDDKTAEDGKLPTFKSDTFSDGKGIADAITFKYYKDEDCTEEVTPDKLEPGESYYTKAVLKDGADANFEFGTDLVTQKYVTEGFIYDEPEVEKPPVEEPPDDDPTPVVPDDPTPVEPEPEKESFFTKKFLGLPVWAWLVILLVILLLIILLIVVLGKRKKDDENKAQQNGGAVVTAGGVAVGGVSDATFAAKTEKMEDRMRALEDKAHEREITRYKEEVEKANKAQPYAAAGVAADAAYNAKTEKMEDRIRELEHEAHEREITRYKEEAERAKKEAELKAAAASAQPFAGAAAAGVAADAAYNAKTEKMEDRIRQLEHEANDREMARLREEIEKAKNAAQQPVAGAAAGATAADAYNAKLEERIREMEREAHDREIERLREEIERAKNAAQQPVAGAAAGATAADAYNAKLEERIREMEREAHDREIARLREEIERAKSAPAGAAAGAAVDPALAAKTERMEERIREMEREAHEREIERLKEEIERAKNAPVAGAAAATVAQPDSATTQRIAQLEDELKRYEEQMREEKRRREDAEREAERKNAEERIAQMRADAEREVARIREEAEKAAGAMNNQMNQPNAAAFVSTEMLNRLTQLEDNMKRREEAMREEMRRQEDAQREAERKAAEERIAQMKADAEREVERIKEEARRAASEMNKPKTAAAATSADMAMNARFAQLEEELKRREEELRNQMRRQEEAQREVERKNAEARIAQMKEDAEREAIRIKEEAERIKEEARKTAEDIKLQSEIAASRQPITAAGLHIKTEGDMDAETAAVLRDYQDRMRKMEQELQEQRMTNLMRENTEKARKEMEEATKMRRHEEEMQRLRDLQDYERRQRQDMQNMQAMPYMQPFMQQQPYGGQFGNPADAYMRQQQELEAQRLKLLEERLKQREMEVQMLRSQSFGMPQQPFGAQPYGAPYGQPGYAPVQPGYPPVQPGYPPVQPGYPQPGYAPNPYAPLGDKK